MIHTRIKKNSIPPVIMELKTELEDFGLFRCEFIGEYLVLLEKNTNKVYLTVNLIKEECYLIFYNFWIEEYVFEQELITKVKEGLYNRGDLPIYKELENLKRTL